MSSPQPAARVEAVPVRHPLRWVGAAVVVLLGVMFATSLANNKNLAWDVVGHYLFNHVVLVGVVHTIELTLIAMVVGVALGVLLAVLRLSPNPILSAASWLYIWFFRGTPVLVQILFWYNLGLLFAHLGFGIPFGPTFFSAKTNNVDTPFVAAILGLGLNEAAYMAEIVRAGIISVDFGQTEAAQALGMARSLVMRRIVLPQAMRVIVPPTGNETISMLKTTSLVTLVAYLDLLTAVRNIYAVNYRTIELLIVASLWYLLLTSVATAGQFYVERYFGRGSARAMPDTPLQRLRRNLTTLRRMPQPREDQR